MPEDNIRNILAEIRRNIESIPQGRSRETAPPAVELPAQEPTPTRERPSVPPSDEGVLNKDSYDIDLSSEQIVPRPPETGTGMEDGSPALRREFWFSLGQAFAAGLAAFAAYKEDFLLLAMGLAGFFGVILAGAILPRGSPYMALRSMERRLENLERRMDSLKFSSGGVSSELEEEIRELRGILRSLVGSLEGPKNGE